MRCGVFATHAPCLNHRLSLEIQRQPRSHRARSHKVCTAESRKEVVQRCLVSHVDRRQIEIYFVAFLAENVLLAE